MKHLEHQCRHKDSWRNPAEDHPNIRGGEFFLSHNRISKKNTENVNNLVLIMYRCFVVVEI